jgi:predicted transcriptional regulator
MNKKKSIQVRAVMKTTVNFIDGAATIDDALKQMKADYTSVLIVDKRFEGDEYGMITSADIARHVLAHDKAPSRVNVYEIMTIPVISVAADMDIRYCSKLFAQYDLIRAPVVENGKIIGLVSPNSLVLDGLYEICR